ncbi:lipolytic enzyme [gamma proteobacterium HdN1]|nr:lipolytic enzyme [gamma proteobacterium HdN1]
MIAPMRPLLSAVGSLVPLPANTVIKTFGIGSFGAEWVYSRKSPDIAKERVLLYLHGGGYVVGSPATHRNITSRLARYGRCRVLAINYRKSPEYPFPYALEDAVAAYRFLLGEGYAPERITIAGDSAGGNLTFLTAIALRDRGLPAPAGIIGISPWTDLSSSGDSYRSLRSADPMIPARRVRHAALLHANGLPLDSPKLSPLFADLHDLPRTLVHVGGNEVLLSDALRFVDRARNYGVNADVRIWPNAPHVFQIFAGIVPQSKQSLREIGHFMRRCWEDSVSAEVPSFNARPAALDDGYYGLQFAG